MSPDTFSQAHLQLRVVLHFIVSFDPVECRRRDTGTTYTLAANSPWGTNNANTADSVGLYSSDAQRFSKDELGALFGWYVRPTSMPHVHR